MFNKVCGMCAILCFIFTSVVFIRAGRAEAQRDDAVSFDGQFLSVVKKSDPSSSVELEKVQLRSIGGKPFLVGRGAETPDNWQKGRVVWVALDDVAEWTAFASIDDLRKAGPPPAKTDSE